MARMARLVVPGLPHHVTQRGVRSMDVFDVVNDDEDRRLYLPLMDEVEARRLERALSTGRPLGSEGFVEGLERRAGRRLRRLRPGPPKRRRRRRG